MSSDSVTLLTQSWTPIAMRPRASATGVLLVWSPLPDAPLDVAGAWQLADAGMILMAQRHFLDRIELVVRATGMPAGAPHDDRQKADKRPEHRSDSKRMVRAGQVD
jgi:hypothetical protein